METVQLIRNTTGDQGTFGTLLFGTGRCFTTELPWRDNIPQKSCIPVGSYIAKIVNSPRFGKVYGVSYVPGRSNILIHSANVGGNTDMGWDTELQGCIAPSLKQGLLLNKQGVMQRAGLVSRPAVRALMDWAQSKPFILVIK